MYLGQQWKEISEALFGYAPIRYSNATVFLDSNYDIINEKNVYKEHVDQIKMAKR